MCGIVGAWGGRVSENLALSMAGRLHSRGPDSKGSFVDASVGLLMAHRRLSIMDLSDAGGQPMRSPDGRYTLVYNGEIYNHQAIRTKLVEGCGALRWNSTSDTETLLVALERWGVGKTLSALNGMFSFALWDSYEKRLTLARDRFGEKPLYYGLSNEVFFFGSQLNAFYPHEKWRGIVDHSLVPGFLHRGYISGPKSIFKGICKLPPGSFISVSKASWSEMPEPVAYWKASDNIIQATLAGSGLHVDEVLPELDQRITTSVRSRMIADVPLGAFLSGGYDSTMVVAKMQELSPQPVKTFTIGFTSPEFDEAQHAREVAHFLGTDHTELYISSDDAISVIPKLATMFDEPFADASQVPTYLVAELARRSVKVCLSGDGGDELFGGYARHHFIHSYWPKLSKMPHAFRYAISQSVDERFLSYLSKSSARLLGKRVGSLSGERSMKLLMAFKQKNILDVYESMLSGVPNKDVARVCRFAAESENQASEYHLPNLSDLDKFILWDTTGYLPDDILTKIDRATMAVSLEARVPLLDHDLARFAWSIPSDMKIKDGKAKWPLRQLVHRYVPEGLMNRPKMGFGVPLTYWIAGPLREWAVDLLFDETSFEQAEILDHQGIGAIWHEHDSGLRDHTKLIWNLLMLKAWLRSIE